MLWSILEKKASSHLHEARAYAAPAFVMGHLVEVFDKQTLMGVQSGGADKACRFTVYQSENVAVFASELRNGRSGRDPESRGHLIVGQRIIRTLEHSKLAGGKRR